MGLTVSLPSRARARPRAPRGAGSVRSARGEQCDRRAAAARAVAVADVGDFFLAIRGEAGRALVRWPRSYGALAPSPLPFWQRPCKLVHAARDHAHGGGSLAQLGHEVNAGRAGRAYDRNLHHDGVPMRSGTKIVSRSNFKAAKWRQRPASPSKGKSTAASLNACAEGTRIKRPSSVKLFFAARGGAVWPASRAALRFAPGLP